MRLCYNATQMYDADVWVLQLGTVGEVTSSMFITDLLYKYLRTAAVGLLVFVSGCRDTVAFTDPLSCGNLFTVRPAGTLRIPLNDSRRVWVQLREQEPYSEGYEGCPPMRLQWFSWTIEDPSVARVEVDAQGFVAVTGLTLGETRLRAQYGNWDDIWRWKTIHVGGS